MNKRKGAVELSASFIVVIIISIVILVGGLALFYNMIGKANNIRTSLDTQTEDNIKSMMLSNNYRVAVYPPDATISNGKAQLIGVGVTNIYDGTEKFYVDVKVKRYTELFPNGEVISDADIISTYVDIPDSSLEFTIAPSQQLAKGLLLRMPKDADKGQYVYTINVTTKDINSLPVAYGLVQVYVNNP